MASSSSSYPIPNSSSRLWNYDVFLSFRGEDTRKNFVDHLYTALLQIGIHTYKDDETLPRGEIIGPALLKAIRESRVAVIVFSENYADSSWCLDELEYIMKCKDDRAQIVMPIFYHVDPSDVRKQKHKYGEAFIKHELKNKNKVEYWRKALTDAGELSGWVTTDIANGHESKGLKEIFDKISERLVPLISDVDEEFIGLRTRLQILNAQLEIGSGGVRMLGIWGVGGGGKTTLASCVYDEIYSEFDGCCFLDNIREKSSKHGLEKLQKKIVLDVLKQKEVRVGRVEEGKRMIKKMLCQKNVLIVLDDVDDLKQLEALAGSHDWFGKGSRIIITTRYNHLLHAHKVNVTHDICLLNDDEAIKLFSKHAPQGNRAIEDYEHFSKKIVSYAGGLPLALKVLGCFLCDKDMNEWISAFSRLKDIPDNNIMEKLKISYDGLLPVEKELFLDIACFYRRELKYRVIERLDACGFHPVIGIKVLIQKALVFIDLKGNFDMHDLVQEMGHSIVRGERPNNPEEHSRVWKEEDIKKICAMDTKMELDKIKAIRYFPSYCKYNYENRESRFAAYWGALRCFPKPNYAFSENVQLRVSTDGIAALPCHPEIIANMKKLRLIEWEGLPGSSLPSNFHVGELCCLTLRSCGQRQLWKGHKFLPNLKFVNLASMDILIMTPDFAGLPNLERFIISDCGSLEEIHPSIGHSESLVFLWIENCCNLKRFPLITRSMKLETLVISKCPKLFKVPEIQKIHVDEFGREVASLKQYLKNLTNWFRCRST